MDTKSKLNIKHEPVKKEEEEEEEIEIIEQTGPKRKKEEVVIIATTSGQRIDQANASAVVAANRAPTKRSLPNKRAAYEDVHTGCLYWDASQVDFDPERVALLRQCNLFDPSTMIVVYIRPPSTKKKPKLPMEGEQIVLMKHTAKPRKTNTEPQTQTFEMVKRLYDYSAASNPRARRTECAIIKFLI